MPQAKKRTPRSFDGHPDLAGFWDNLFNDSVDKKADGSFDFELGGPRIHRTNGPSPTSRLISPNISTRSRSWSKRKTATARRWTAIRLQAVGRATRNSRAAANRPDPETDCDSL